MFIAAVELIDPFFLPLPCASREFFNLNMGYTTQAQMNALLPI